jgi:peroxiredoxin (alkyl hydroperoxide reductase subunit C)
MAYHNGEKVSISSSDYTGKWLVLYWWPFNFTGICQSEVEAFEALSAQFSENEISLVGVSCDSVHAHAVWARSEAFSGGVSHPLVGDATHAMTKSYGLYAKKIGCALRGTVIVNPDGMVVSKSANFLPVARDPKDVLATALAFKNGACTVGNRPKI